MTLPTTGVHHITLNGSTRQQTIDFYEGVLGMPLVFEQPNLDAPEINHLYFDPGDGNLLTFFVTDDRPRDPRPVPEAIGSVHHLAFAVSRQTFDRATARLSELGYPNTGPVDRGFMDSLYFRDPNGLRLELATYKFAPPPGHTHAEVLAAAHRLRLEQGDYNITLKHLNQAIERMQAVPAGS